MKFLRDRVRSLEIDNDALNEKYRKEVASREQLFLANDQINKALRRANMKIAEVKEKYRSRIAKKCYYCNNELDLMQQTLGLGSTLDNITTEMNRSFLTGKSQINTHVHPNAMNIIQDDDSFGERLGRDDVESNDEDIILGSSNQGVSPITTEAKAAGGVMLDNFINESPTSPQHPLDSSD